VSLSPKAGRSTQRPNWNRFSGCHEDYASCLAQYNEATAAVGELLSILMGPSVSRPDAVLIETFAEYKFMQEALAEKLRHSRSGAPIREPGDLPATDVLDVLDEKRAENEPVHVPLRDTGVRKPSADAAIRLSLGVIPPRMEPEPSPRHPDTPDTPRSSPSAEEASMASIYPQAQDRDFEDFIADESIVLANVARSVYYGPNRVPSQDESGIPDDDYLRILDKVEGYLNRPSVS
jgi:hypothetical protein